LSNQQANLQSNSATNIADGVLNSSSGVSDDDSFASDVDISDQGSSSTHASEGPAKK